MPENNTSEVWGNLTFEEVVLAFGRRSGKKKENHLVSHPMLAALGHVGTSHLYADTADTEELNNVLASGEHTGYLEVDGNTINPPLMNKVLRRYLKESDPMTWAQELFSRKENMKEEELLPILFTVLCGRVGNDFLHQFASGRNWEISLQLHMGICKNTELAKYVGRFLRGMVSMALVKVPFMPHSPQCFLIARDLELGGIPVNFTSTFSSRQVVAAALLANVSRTNIFMGRLDQGLEADFLGAHVCLEAQRFLTQLRQKEGVKTLLIVASMRDWRNFIQTAGCDVYTAPCHVIQDFIGQTETFPKDLLCKLQASYEDRLGIREEVLNQMGHERFSRLYRVEPEFIEFLLEYRKTSEFRNLSDGDALIRRFEEVGFGDFFYCPEENEWKEIRKHKIPNINEILSNRISIDTAFSIYSDGDFEKHQEEMDEEISRHLMH